MNTDEKEKQRKVELLQEMTGCSRTVARNALKMHAWILADAFDFLTCD